MLAIVIPYYKIDFFDATLNSLMNQVNKNFKIYIGNDGSDNNPQNIISKYSESLDITYKKFENNLGSSSLVKHWLRCLEMVKDEKWIIVLGDDDLYGSNCIKSFYDNIESISKHNANVIRFATNIINENGEITSEKFEHPVLETSVDFFERKNNGGTRSSLSEYIFKRENFTLKNFPLAWHTDDLAILECSNYSTIYTINNAIVSFRHSSKNITGRVSDLKLKNESSFQFYFFLNKFRKDKFNKIQQKILEDKLNKTLVDNKKNILRTFKVGVLYAKQFQLVAMFKLKTKMFKSLLNKIK